MAAWKKHGNWINQSLTQESVCVLVVDGEQRADVCSGNRNRRQMRRSWGVDQSGNSSKRLVGVVDDLTQVFGSQFVVINACTDLNI